MVVTGELLLLLPAPLSTSSLLYGHWSNEIFNVDSTVYIRSQSPRLFPSRYLSTTIYLVLINNSVVVSQLVCSNGCSFFAYLCYRILNRCMFCDIQRHKTIRTYFFSITELIRTQTLEYIKYYTKHNNTRQRTLFKLLLDFSPLLPRKINNYDT